MRDRAKFITFMAAVFGGHAVGMAIFVSLAGLILEIPVRRLFVPYVTLLYSGLVLASLLYWARLSRERPKSYPFRFAIAMFFYLQVLMLAVGFSTNRLQILSPAEAVSDFGLLVVPLSLFMFVASYLVVRQRVNEPKSM